jgi:hypothetical protein
MQSEASPRLISPLAGEMPGRAEGGRRGRGNTTATGCRTARFRQAPAPAFGMARRPLPSWSALCRPSAAPVPSGSLSDPRDGPEEDAGAGRSPSRREDRRRSGPKATPHLIHQPGSPE